MRQILVNAIINYNTTNGENFEVFCDYNSLKKIDGQWTVKFRTEEQTFEARETRQLGKTIRAAIKTVRSWE